MSKMFRTFHPEENNMVCTLDNGMKAYRLINDEGITSYWWYKNSDSVKVMMNYDEIMQHGLDPYNIMCDLPNGNKMYGKLVLERKGKDKDGNFVWQIWEGKAAKRSRIIIPGAN